MLWCLLPDFDIMISVTIATVQENSFNNRYETFRIDSKSIGIMHASKFARWQHPAVGRGSRFAVPGY